MDFRSFLNRFKFCDIIIQEEITDIKYDMGAASRFENGGYHASWTHPDIIVKSMMWQKFIIDCIPNFKPRGKWFQQSEQPLDW